MVRGTCGTLFLWGVVYFFLFHHRDGGAVEGQKGKLPQPRRRRWDPARVGELAGTTTGPLPAVADPLGAPTGGMVGNSRLGGGLELLSCLAIPLGTAAGRRVPGRTRQRAPRGFRFRLCDAYAFLNAASRLTTPDPEAIERCAESIWPVKERPGPRVELTPRRFPPAGFRVSASGYLPPP